ncbi:MAG: Gfo/Idh/MocA family protein [Candidatus Bipolaricaulota bacterium]
MTLNFGIVGPGNIADRSLAPALAELEQANLWSVLSRSEEKAQEFAEEHQAKGPRSAYTNYDEMLSDPELDVVIISTPDKLHARQGIQAAQAGVHVLTEKPMVANVSEGRELINACEENGVKLGVAYHLRWHRGHRKLLRRIRNGVLGELHHLRVQWTFQASDDSNWRAHSEVGRWWGLAGVGTHCLDLVRWVMVAECGEVTEIDSTIVSPFWNSPHDETALLNLTFESGATAEITTSVLFDSQPEFKVYGRKGSAICRDTLGPHGGGNIICSDQKLPFEQVDPYTGELRDFALAIQEGRSPEVPGEEGLRNVQILTEAAPEK